MTPYAFHKLLVIPIFLAVVLTAVPAESQQRSTNPSRGRDVAVISDHERMLFVGNSYMANEGGVFHYLTQALSTAAEISIQTDKRIYYGQPLQAMLTEDVQAAIASDDFDSVVITSGRLGAMKRFSSLIQAAEKKTIVFMTWSGRHPGHRATEEDYTASTKASVAVMRQLELEEDVTIVPVAVVYHDLTLRPPAGVSRVDYLWRPDNIHQNELGTMVNTWMLYAVLTGRSPVGVDFEMPPFVVGETLRQNPDIRFDTALRRSLQERVWKVAQDWKAGRSHLEHPR